MRPIFVAMEADDDLFEEGAQQLLAISGGGRRCRPDAPQIDTQTQRVAPLFRLLRAGPLLLAAGKLGFGVIEVAQAMLPLRFQTAGD
jgi:hypothetical protein